MIPLTYTQSIAQESLLRKIEMLRVQLSSLVVPPAVDRGVRFDTQLAVIATAFGLEQHPSVYQHIEHTIRSKRSSTPEGIRYRHYWDALCTIHELWVGTDAYVQTNSYADLFREFRKTGNSAWNIVQSHISSGIAYISSGNEHPVIQAAIMSALVYTSPLETDTRREAAMLIAYAVLASHGYVCSGRVNPLSEWAIQSESLQSALHSIDTDKNLNHWILFNSLVLKKTLEDSITVLTNRITDRNITTNRRILLTQRQRSILQLLDKPGSSINNAVLRRRFGISQLTASRDLSYLVSQGVLTAFGKSRSIAYLRSG